MRVEQGKLEIFASKVGRTQISFNLIKRDKKTIGRKSSGMPIVPKTN